ncbi:SgrR family transcriptional regulator [Paenibacillus kobensis]|uniref:SgrR family transcriptional regulator n=1 Tax=Paenibacillus kobensis TaxID=59841 RepID=UPI000FD71071|nr:SgrR family transcriptional regulator [Paenibacillus kobensis]
MLEVERYLTLYQRFAGELGAGATVEAALEQVSDALYCTERNAKLILRKLTEKGYIEWKAGRGRGNRSRITFREDREALLLDLSRAYAEDGEYNKAFYLLQTFGEGTAASEKFMEWMNGTFGFHKQQGTLADVLRLPIKKPMVTLDPAEVIFSFDAHLIQQVWDRLVVLEENTGRILPAIAHEWECNEDATMWTFHLRKSVLFHDGTELTAADVVYTIQRLRSGKQNSWIVRSLSRIEAVSERVVRFHFAKSNWLFIKFACSVLMSILPSGLRGQTEEQFWKHPIGTGPFKIEERAEGKLLLEANAAYYHTRPLLDRVEIVQVPQHDVLKADAARWKQLISDPNQPDLPDLSEDNGWIKIESNNVCTSMLSWNMQRNGLHKSEQFRSIVDRLIDRNRMIRELGGHRYSPANGFFPSAAGSAEVDEASSDEELRHLITQYGFDQSPVTLCSLVGHQEDVQWIQRRCMEYGIQLQIRIESADKLYRIQSEIDAVYHALVFPEDEVSLIESLEQEDSFLSCMVSPEHVVWIRNRLDDALACAKSADRMAIYTEIEAKLRAEHQVLFMLHTRFNTDYHPSLKGVRINTLGWIDFKHIWRA